MVVEDTIYDMIHKNYTRLIDFFKERIPADVEIKATNLVINTPTIQPEKYIFKLIIKIKNKSIVYD